MEKVLVEEPVQLAGVRFKPRWRVLRCPADGTKVVPAKVRAAFESKAARHVATHGPMTGATLRLLRRTAGYSATALARLLGVTPESLSRWENTRQKLNVLVWVATAQLALDKLHGRSTVRKQLQAAAAVEPQHHRFEIDLRAGKRRRTKAVPITKEEHEALVAEAMEGALEQLHDEVVGVLREESAQHRHDVAVKRSSVWGPPRPAVKPS